MGQKINPHGLRVGVIKDWDSRWFANDSDFGDSIVEDYKIRKFHASSIIRINLRRSSVFRLSSSASSGAVFRRFSFAAR